MRLIPAGNLDQTEPVLPIRWCLEAREGYELREQKAENIHILFVIAYEGTDLEDRYLVPIDQVMTYLPFRRPGRHLVLAKVVWGSENHLGSLVRKVDFRRYYNDLLDKEHKERTSFIDRYTFRWISDCQCLDGSAEAEVTIQAEYFPREWPAWLKYLAEVGHEYPSFDQCQMRRRLAFAPVKLFFFGLWAVITTVTRVSIAAFLTLCAMREVDYGAILHPFRDDIRDIYAHVHSTSPGSWLVRNKDGVSRTAWFVLLHPMIYLAAFAALTGCKIYLHTTYLALLTAISSAIQSLALMIWSILILFFMNAWIAILAMALAVVLASFLAGWTVRAIKRRREMEAAPDFLALREQEKLQAYDDLYKLLACRADPLIASISALPRERQTLHLRYLELKAKLCRPFAAE